MPISIGGFINFIANQVRQAQQSSQTGTTGTTNTNTTGTGNTVTGQSQTDEFVQTNNNNAYQRLLGGFTEPLAAVWNAVSEQASRTQGQPRDPRLPEGAEVPPPLGDFSDLAELNMASATPEQIQRVQDALIELGYMKEDVRTNSGYGNTWGPTSQGALRQFQLDHGLSPNPNTISPDTANYLGTPLTTGQYSDGPKNVLMPQAAYQPATGTWPPTPPTPDFQSLANPELAATLTDFDSDNPEQILAAQQRLLELGFFPPEEASNDGFGNAFGPLSRQAVKDFQLAHGIDPADGKMFEETIAALANPEAVGPHFGATPGTYPGTYGPMGPPNQLAESALNTSAAQMNPETATLEYNGVSLREDPNVWNNRCLAFVARSYEPRVPLLAAADAITAYNNFNNAGLIVNSRADIPAGVPMFFDTSGANGGNGHVVIFTGRYTESGEPIVRSTGWPERPGVWEVPLSEMERLTEAPYLGWGNITGQPNPSV